MKRFTQTLTVVAIATLALTFASPTNAAVLVADAAANDNLLVYEGLDYGTAAAIRAGADLFDGQPDGSGGDGNATGLSGTWEDSTAVTSTSDLFMATWSLAFGDLPTSGNHVRGDSNLNNDNFSRAVSADLDSGSELWFSILANKLQNNNSAGEGGFVIGNQAVNNPRVLLDTGATGLQGFGVAPTTNGNDWTAYAWDGSSQSVGDAHLDVTVGGSDIHLLVGKISFNTGTAGADEFTLYDYVLNAGSVVGGTLNAIASTIEIDVDESLLDTLSLTRQVNVAYDEIRIGTTQNDVLGIISVPTPAALPAGFAMLGIVAARRRRHG